MAAIPRQSVVLVLGIGLVTAVLGGSSCSASNGGSGFGDDDASGSTQSGANGGQGGQGGLFGNGGANVGGGSDCPIHCSADLHQVLDCNENVVTTCPPDQGCGPGGVCIAPCDSAKENKSTIGCDFYSIPPGPETETRGSCFAAMLANTWTSPVTITAEYAGMPLDIASIARTPVGSGASITYQPLTNGQLAPGEIGIVFLSQYPSGDIFWVPCPAGTTAAINNNVVVTGTGYGEAFHITTSAPVVAYDIFPYGGAASFVSSATLLVPTPTWGTNVIAADAYATDPNLAFVNGFPHIQIVAAEDGTNVTISPTAAIVGGPGVAGTGQGQPATYSLNRGQMLQFQQDARLAGSPISADKPISVWGGTACMNIPVGNYACDSGHQQLLPVQALGNEYLGVRYRDRIQGANEIVPYQIIGAVDGTTLTYDPAPPPGAPAGLMSGQLVEFSTSEPFMVRSQDADHPFYMAINMTGAGAVPGNFNNDGDPEFVNIIPPQQYLNHYLFLTDPTYLNTHLVFTRKKGKDNAFHDVMLDCAGILTGWQPIGVGGQYEYTRVDLVVGGASVGGCNNGVHTADSTEPFGLTVWGWDVTVSYGYPAGMSVEPINTVIVPPDPK
jgi:hypothetical protein